MRRRVLVLVLVLAALVLVACPDDPATPAVTATDTFDADVTDTPSVPEVPDSSHDVSAPALPDTSDPGPPPLNCAAECAAWTPVVEACLSELGLLSTASAQSWPFGYGPDPNAVALELDHASADRVLAIRAVVGESVELRARHTPELVLLRGPWVRLRLERLLALPGVSRELPALRDPAGRTVVATERLIVRLNDPDADPAEALDSAHVAPVRALAVGVPGVWLGELSGPPQDIFGAAARLAARDDVAWAEPDLIRPYDSRAWDDPLYPLQWHLNPGSNALVQRHFLPPSSAASVARKLLLAIAPSKSGIWTIPGQSQYRCIGPSAACSQALHLAAVSLKR